MNRLSASQRRTVRGGLKKRIYSFLAYVRDVRLSPRAFCTIFVQNCGGLKQKRFDNLRGLRGVGYTRFEFNFLQL